MTTRRGIRRSALVIAAIALAASASVLTGVDEAGALRASATHLILLPRNQTVGNAQVLHATIGGHPMPSGQVQFFADNAPIGAPVPVVNRVATLTSTFTLGSHTASATYGNDPNLAGSTSAPVSFVVGNRSGTRAQLLYRSVPKGIPVTSWTATTHVTFVGNVAIAAGDVNYGARMGNATVSVDGTHYDVTVAKSRIVLDFPGGLGVGSHTATFTYHGDIHYLADTGATRHITITHP